MNKKMVATGSFFAALSVMLGAFAAHALDTKLSERMMKTFETAARYQMYHAIAIIICGIIFNENNKVIYKISFTLFLIGIILFCSALYTLSICSIYYGTSFNWFGAIAPLGGICFVLGWIALAKAVLNKKTNQ